MTRFFGWIFCLGWLASAVPAAESWTFAADDDFSGYAPGADAAPAWDTGVYGWSVSNGAFTCAEPGKDMALLARAPHGRHVRVEADLVVARAVTPGWKVAGVCVQQDSRNYWHLALVEAPDRDGCRHFVELSEMLDGVWNAQSEEGTRVVVSHSRSSAAPWRFGERYRLMLELAPGGVSGIVIGPDGVELSAIAYALTNRAVLSGRPGLTAGGFATAFDHVTARVGLPLPPPALPAAPPPYVPRTPGPLRQTATGFFRVAQEGETWWLFDPAGTAFFAIGTDHVTYQAHWCEKLGYAPYHRNCEQRYGGEARWSDATVARLLAWGFNTVGAGSSESVRHRGLAHVELLGMGTEFARRDPITPRSTWTGFPNVFSPDFPAFCDKLARQRCAPNREDPWLLGYFLDNELEWHAWTGAGPFHDTFRKPAGHSAKAALVAFLKERYATAEALNRAWGLDLASLDDLAGLTNPPPAATESARADTRDFVRLAAERYFGVATEAIRRHDPNHLVLGCRFAGQAPDIWDIAGQYCDAVSVNCYRTLDLRTGRMTDGFEDDLRRWHVEAKKPLLITEWSFPALDAGLPCEHGAGQRVPTQADRAFAFTAFQKLLAATPFVVGSHFFMWADEPALGISAVFPEDSNYGLVNEQDEPYAALTRVAAALNPRLPDLHRGLASDLRVSASDEDGVFVITNAGTVEAACSVLLWVDGAPTRHDLSVPAGTARQVAATSAFTRQPGGHVFLCRIAPADSMLDRGTDARDSHQLLYRPGAAWPERVAGQAPVGRLPLVVANPADTDSTNVSVAFVLPADWPADDAGVPANAVVLDADTGSAVPGQVDRLEDGPQLALLLDRLPARSGRTLQAYPTGVGAAASPAVAPAVRYRQTGLAFEADNGVLQLARSDGASGDAVEQIAMMGLGRLGSLNLLAWQQGEPNHWLKPDGIESLRSSSGPVRLVLDMVVAYRPLADTTRYRALQRLVVYPGQPWFESRVRWIENNGAAPWRLGGYYHYTPSALGGSRENDRAQGNRWTDAAVGASFGVVPGSPQITVRFWTDPEGRQHPDALRRLDATLQPGQRLADPEPLAYVLGGTTNDWVQTARFLGDGREPLVRAFRMERLQLKND